MISPRESFRLSVLIRHEDAACMTKHDLASMTKAHDSPEESNLVFETCTKCTLGGLQKYF